ncbi:MAG TPA: tRNA uracil 4-sulfurtransferase ThiI [Spirochaetia bacterium]|nr:tRNA uracil 4-sulfurtransferase ThiI [Spirochaetia bacterium]
MSQILFLVKYGEIALKRGNRGAFMKRLKDSIRERLPGRQVDVYDTFQRVFVRCDEQDREGVSGALSRTFGVVSFCETLRVPAEISAVERAAEELAGSFQAAGPRFKAEVRRAEKTFPLTSYEIACRVGDVILSAFPDLKVDVHQPDWVITIEMREYAYLYGPSVRGPSGLPGGSSGRGLLLLSGGIDSPVAGWMMAKRGLALEAVYFHSAPFTSEKAREKVEDLVRTLAPWIPGLVLHVVPFTPVLARIKERSADEEVTLLLRACMMRFATLMAYQRRALCLVTGESLGQVASQTVESMGFTGSFTDLPVFRPLVGMNKDEIISVAEKLRTFDISNRPYADCCTLFAPEHPLVHPDAVKMRRSYERLEVEPLLEEALKQAETAAL